MVKVFSFDVESDGLWGQAFAVGAVVFENGEVIAKFDGIAEQEAVKNEWVHENVLPHLQSLTQFETRKEMREAFWAFYTQHKEGAAIISDCGQPVETNFIRECVADDMENRQWSAPFPLHEVATMLLVKGIDPNVNRIEYSGYNGTAHNPTDDAIASALCWIKAQKEEK